MATGCQDIAWEFGGGGYATSSHFLSKTRMGQKDQGFCINNHTHMRMWMNEMCHGISCVCAQQTLRDKGTKPPEVEGCDHSQVSKPDAPGQASSPGTGGGILWVIQLSEEEAHVS